MVIACEHCNTRFQLDDARVPDTGVRVRCSRCKHAFFVAPPGGAEEALHAAAADAAAAEAPSPPPPTEDLPPSMGSADGEPDAELEEDWQFNIPESGGSDAPAAEDASSPAPPPAQPLLSDSTPLAAPRTEEAPPSLPEAQPHETREHSFEPQPGDDDLRDQLFGDADAGEVPDDSGADYNAVDLVHSGISASTDRISRHPVTTRSARPGVAPDLVR